MKPGALQVAGTGVDSAGQPVGGATVMWVQGPVALPDVALLTQPDGRFVLGAPVVGHYTLGCRHDRHGQATAAVVVEPQGARVTIRLG